MLTLGARVQANVTYTLTVTIGAREDQAFTCYIAALMAGNIVVAEGNHATPVGGSFVDEVVTYNSGSSPILLGQPLQILIKSLEIGQAEVAYVTLTATAH
jgi:hypothetical protein